MSKPQLYFNRELSWLKFNERVLEEANCAETPLYERLRFLNIFASNLDEFYMVRIGSLLDQSMVQEEITENKTGMTPEEQIRAANQVVRKLYPLRDQTYFEIMEGFSAFSYQPVSLEVLQQEEQRLVRDYFEREILPVLSPLVIDARHPFPHLENRQLHIGALLQSQDTQMYGIIGMPRGVSRVFFLPNSKKFVLLEDILLYYVQDAFEMYEVKEHMVFRITRNADIEFGEGVFDEEHEYREQMKELLKKRRKLSPVRIETSMEPNEELLDFFLGRLMLSKEQLFPSAAPLEFSFISQIENRFTAQEKEALLYAPLKPQKTAVLANSAVTPQILHKDVLLSYPYHSMKPFVEVVHEAAEDARVTSIHMTMYRVGNQSKVVQYLCEAAEKGKEVVVIVELRARFDEENNINWADRLEEAGCTVIHGIEDFKIHAKLLLITRRIHGKVQHIVNVSTGNFNESTAKLYGDLSFFTTDPIICDDAVLFFRNMKVGNLQGKYRKLLVAPYELKEHIQDLISQEISKADAGMPARIVAKMNSLTDKDIMKAFIKASQAGVRVTLIIRGICCLRPGVEGYTENIEVRSIVGRFLEHARVFCFGEGESAVFYIGSADMMTRNTERRVELMAPIQDKRLITQLNEMLELQMKDSVKARVLGEDGIYRFAEVHGEAIDSQMTLYKKAYKDAERNNPVKPAVKFAMPAPIVHLKKVIQKRMKYK